MILSPQMLEFIINFCLTMSAIAPIILLVLFYLDKRNGRLW